MRQYPTNHRINRQRSPRRMAVVGGGLAAASMVKALADEAQACDHDLCLTVFAPWVNPKSIPVSSPENLMSQRSASAVPIAVMHPLHSMDENLASQFFRQGVLTSEFWIDQLKGVEHGWACLSGVKQRSRNPDSDERLFSDQAGGWVIPVRWILACINRASEILDDRLKIVRDPAEIDPSHFNELLAQFDLVILCTAHDNLVSQAGLYIQPLGGQISWVDTGNYPNLRGLAPNQVVCDQGFVTPEIHRRIFFGATFNRGCLDAKVTPEDHRRNLVKLSEMCPLLAHSLAKGQYSLGGWSGVRFSTRDRMPHIGQPLSASCYRDSYGAWPLRRSVSRLDQVPRHDRLYVFLGLGARGISAAALGAELLVAQIFGKKPILSARLCSAVDPARFVLRDFARSDQHVRLGGYESSAITGSP